MNVKTVLQEARQPKPPHLRPVGVLGIILMLLAVGCWIVAVEPLRVDPVWFLAAKVSGMAGLACWLVAVQCHERQRSPFPD